MRSNRWKSPLAAAVLVVSLLGCEGQGAIDSNPPSTVSPTGGDAFNPYGRFRGERVLVRRGDYWVIGTVADPGVLESDPPQLRVALPEGTTPLLSSELRDAGQLLHGTVHLQWFDGANWSVARDWAVGPDVLLMRRDTGAAWEAVEFGRIRFEIVPAQSR